MWAFNCPNLRNRSGGRAFMKSRDILTAQLGRKVTCPRPRWHFTACWAEVTPMTSLSPEMPGRYSAALLPGFTTQSRKWLHLLGFLARPVYQFYPEEVGQRGAGAFNRTLSWAVIYLKNIRICWLNLWVCGWVPIKSTQCLTTTCIIRHVIS